MTPKLRGLGHFIGTGFHRGATSTINSLEENKGVGCSATISVGCVALFKGWYCYRAGAPLIQTITNQKIIC